MRHKGQLRGAVLKGGRPRFWTGLPIGFGITWAAIKWMPAFGDPSTVDPWGKPVPYRIPGLVVGLGLAAHPTTRMMGLGVLTATAAYYLYAVVYNLGWTASDQYAAKQANEPTN